MREKIRRGVDCACTVEDICHYHLNKIITRALIIGSSAIVGLCVLLQVPWLSVVVIPAWYITSKATRP